MIKVFSGEQSPEKTNLKYRSKESVMKEKNNRISTVILIFMLILGLSLLLYPTFSDYWNSLFQSKAIANYANAVSEIDNDKYAEMISDAKAYNEILRERSNRWILSEEEKEEYGKILDISGTGVMGYIEIPSIDVALPIHHGVAEEVLQVAIGHLPGSSIPVGGLGTHAVVSGHRGLPSARLFTDLDQLAKGDLFVMRILDETLTYEVDQIRIVLPNEMEELQIDEEQDYCTLVTCTPYGINTHRMLVRGHRVDNVEDISIRVTADAMQVDSRIVASVLAIIMLLILLAGVMITHGKRR